MLRTFTSKMITLNSHSALFIAALALAILSISPRHAHAQNFMTQEELLATIPGSQLSGISNQDGKTPWIQAYSKATKSKKGLLNGLWDNKDKYQSEWYVDGDQWCEKWDSGEGCWQIERVSAKKLRAYKNGKPFKQIWNLK